MRKCSDKHTQPTQTNSIALYFSHWMHSPNNRNSSTIYAPELRKLTFHRKFMFCDSFWTWKMYFVQTAWLKNGNSLMTQIWFRHPLLDTKIFGWNQFNHRKCDLKLKWSVLYFYASGKWLRLYLPPRTYQNVCNFYSKFFAAINICEKMPLLEYKMQFRRLQSVNVNFIGGILS